MDLLCFFHRLSYFLGHQLDESLYQQRQSFFGQDTPLSELKEVYDYFELRYEWCLLRLSPGNTTVIQVFPRVQRSSTWKHKVLEILGNEPEISKRE
jgi:hypothetical protein